MSISNITLIIPLQDAQRSRKTGSKATNLSKLIAAHFAVPRGFVISADAYKSHLWASGARQIASAQPQAEEREAIRASILKHDIPDDVWQAVTQAYERLSWQTGLSEPKVAVRSSSLEEGPNGAELVGAYESCINVSGIDELRAAIKRVWASLWSGKAAAYRARYSITSEPAMAVIVQQMVESTCTGSAFTANQVTGDPNKILISSFPSGKADHFTVDLHDMSVAHQLDPEESSGDIARIVAEQSILVEEAISGRIEIEWAWNREGLWILQARRIAGLPHYFPIQNKSDETITWHRLSSRPVSHFMRSLLWHTPRTSRIINGYVYRRDESKSAAQSGKEAAAAGRLLKRWKNEAPGLRSRTAALIASNLSTIDQPGLSRKLTGAVTAAQNAAKWLERSTRPSTHFPALLRELIDRLEDPPLYGRLIGGLRDVTFMRDAKLQELGERFAIAEGSGKLNDEKWWRGYKRDVEKLARDYGYAFRDIDESLDAATWRSWIEDTDAVFRLIGAMARMDKRPSLVTMHCAAEREAELAREQALKLIKSSQRAELRRLLRLARGWLESRSEIEQAYTHACAALRLVLAEMSKRLVEAGIIAHKDDIFYLTINELLNAAAGSREIASKIANRKHDVWLEHRLIAPKRLPAGAAAETGRTENQIDGELRGLAASPGITSGRARIVNRIEDAGEIEVGDILIVKSPSPAWTPLLAVAGGLVSEQDHNLELDAITARERGIPAVFGCEGVLAVVREGQKITLDGSAGKVEFTPR